MTASTPTATAPTTPTATAPTTRSLPNPTMVRAPPLHHQVVAAGRTQTTATTAGAAVPDYASHELSDGDAAACSAVDGSAVLRHCQRALQPLHDGGVHASTAAAAAPDARAHPLPVSDLILLARAAACSTAVPQLPSAALVSAVSVVARQRAIRMIFCEEGV